MDYSTPSDEHRRSEDEASDLLTPHLGSPGEEISKDSGAAIDGRRQARVSCDHGKLGGRRQLGAGQERQDGRVGRR